MSPIKHFYGPHLADALPALAELAELSWSEEWPDEAGPPRDATERRLAASLDDELEAGYGLVPSMLAQGGHVRLVPQAPKLTCIAHDASGAAIGMALLMPNPVAVTHAGLKVWVRPDRRRLGVATALIRSIVEYARKHAIDLIEFRTLSHVPAGGALAQRLRATPTIVVKVIETPAAELASGNLRLQRRYEHDDVTIDVSAGPIASEQRLHDIAALSLPIGRRYGTQMSRLSPEQAAEGLRRAREKLAALGMETWTISALRADGTCVGFSTYLWDPDLPRVLTHMALAVAESHRGGTLGRRLLDWGEHVIAMRPQVTRVRHLRLGQVSDLQGHTRIGDRGIHHFEIRWHTWTSHLADHVEASPRVGRFSRR